MTTETLAHDVAWEPSGHLSEVALSVIADGEDALLDAPMHAHIAACEECAIKLGEIALRAADVGEALVSAAAPVVVQAVANEAVNDLASAKGKAAAPVVVPQAALNELAKDLASAPLTVRPASSRRKVPVLPIVAAMAIAMLGALPSVARVREQISQTWSVLYDVAPAIVRLGPQALAKAWSGPQSSRMLPVVWALAAVLVAAGLAIASRASKKMLVDGGRR